MKRKLAIALAVLLAAVSVPTSVMADGTLVQSDEAQQQSQIEDTQLSDENNIQDSENIESISGIIPENSDSVSAGSSPSDSDVSNSDTQPGSGTTDSHTQTDSDVQSDSDIQEDSVTNPETQSDSDVTQVSSEPSGTDSTQESIISLKDKLLSAEDITGLLPYTQDISITEEDVYLDYQNSQSYGKAYKISLENGDIIDASCFGKDKVYADVYVGIYSYNGSDFSQLYEFDNDNVLGTGGEEFSFSASNAGEYYILLSTYDATEAMLSFSLELSEMSGNAVTIEELMASAEAIENLPHTSSFQLGPDSDIYIVNNSSFAAHASKMTLSAGERIVLLREGANSEGMTYLNVVNSKGETVDYSAMISYGDWSVFTAPADDDYFFIFLASDTSSMSEYSLTVMSYDSLYTVNGLLDMAETVTSGQYSDTVDFGDLPLAKEEAEISRYVYSGKAYKFNLSAGEGLYALVSRHEDSYLSNTVIAVYTKQDGGYKLEYYCDSANNASEHCTFIPETSGEYYVLIRGYAYNDFVADVSFSVYNMNGYLDFTGSEAAEPSSGDCWSWDPDTKTLTLSDGFSIATNNEPYPTITVPDGAVIVVEDNATVDITAFGGYAIYCYGSYTIEMGNSAVMNLTAANRDAVYAYDSLIINGSADSSERPMITGYSHGNFLNAEEGKLDIFGCDVTADTYRNGLSSGSDMTADSSYLDIYSENSSAVSAGSISLINCVSVLDAPNLSSIECMSEGGFECIGGSLKATALDGVIYSEAGPIRLSGVKLDLTGSSRNPVIIMDNEAVLTIDGRFRLYNELDDIYEGFMDDSLYNNSSHVLMSDGRVATRLVSTYAVIFYDDDGTTVLKDTQYVDYGSSAVAPEAPSKPDSEEYRYTFAGWDTAFDSVDRDLNIKAVYSKEIIEDDIPVDPSDPSDPSGPSEPTVTPGGDSDNTPNTSGNTSENDNDTSNSKATSAAQTSDMSESAVPSAILLISAVSALTILALRKKNRG